MSFNLTIDNDFAVSRTTKSGKTTYRGALGVLTSGNAKEKAQLGAVALEAIIANHNYRHLMREVERVFPLAFMKKAKGQVAVTKGQDGEPIMWFLTETNDGGTIKREMEQYDGYTKANKIMTHKYAKAVIAVADADPEKIKGEKALYLAALRGMVEREQARLAAAEAPV